MPEPQLQYVPFVVDETPHACWEWNLSKRNLEFLRGLDPSYFTYVADTNVEHLEGEHKQKAALALRIAYSQALETLFALLGALVQAPECVFGWLLAYTNRDLDKLIEKLASGVPVRSRLTGALTWDNLSGMVHQHLPYDEEKKAWVTKGFAEAWARFAGEFLNKKIASEYNSVKHGFRARMGGFVLRVGPEDVPGQLARPEVMRTVGGSTFGTSFYSIEKLGEGKTNFRARQNSRNWIPDNLANALYLLAMSIGNVASALRVLNGDPPDQCEFKNPDAPDQFDAAWRLSPGVTDCSFDLTLVPEQVQPRSGKEILDSYKDSPSPSA